MSACVNDGRPAASFAASENGARHFELSKALCERQQRGTDRSTMGHLGHSVVETEKRVEGDEPLVIEHCTDLVGYFVVDALAVGIIVVRPTKQVNDLVLGERSISSRGFDRCLQRGPSRIEKLDRCLKTEKGLNRFLPRR